MRLRILLTATMILPVASSCSMFEGPETAKLHKSPTFREGYEDGCASGNQQGADLRDRLVKDPDLYKSDETYRTGWSNGFSACRTSNSAPGTQPGADPLGGPLPGTH
jgi:hypothetical protein